MSYLHFPRLVFAGDFLSDVSTVNNDITHYNNATFQPNFQEYGKGAKNGWWNPEGGAVFDFQKCTVDKITYLDGTTSNELPSDLVGQLVKGAEGRATGKMVDLDPQQQGVSELWAVRLRILTPEDEVLLEGDLGVTPFRDLQQRQHGGIDVNGQALGASWTTVLKNVNWGEKALDYRFFKELKETTAGNRLSVNLSAFGYYYNHAEDGRFSLGKILGAIGPWFKNEPETFVAERRLFGTQLWGSSQFFTISNFTCDLNRHHISIDLGNSFPIADAIGTVTFNQDLVVGVSKNPLNNTPSKTPVSISAGDFIEIGKVDYSQGDWLAESGGIIDFTNISYEIKTAVAAQQLILVTAIGNNQYKLIARESVDGYLFRADNFVLRLDAEESETVTFFARQWGNPISTGTATVKLESPTPVIPKGPRSPICEQPGNNYPIDGLSFETNANIKNGKAKLEIQGNKIHNPRGYIDGQIYTISYAMDNSSTDPANTTADAISIHLRDYFPIPDEPVWSDISATMQQFSNLYPIMSKYFVDLADPVALIEKKDILIFAFTQDIHDPMYMPASRDLSETKRLTILKWLAHPKINKIESDIVALESTEKGAIKLMESPAKDGHELSEMQQRLIKAMRMKSGAEMNFEPIENLNL